MSKYKMRQDINRGEAIKYFCKKQCNADKPCDTPIPLLNCGVELLYEVPSVRRKERQ